MNARGALLPVALLLAGAARAIPVSVNWSIHGTGTGPGVVDATAQGTMTTVAVGACGVCQALHDTQGTGGTKCAQRRVNDLPSGPILRVPVTGAAAGVALVSVEVSGQDLTYQGAFTDAATGQTVLCNGGCEYHVTLPAGNTNAEFWFPWIGGSETIYACGCPGCSGGPGCCACALGGACGYGGSVGSVTITYKRPSATAPYTCPPAGGTAIIAADAVWYQIAVGCEAPNHDTTWTAEVTGGGGGGWQSGNVNVEHLLAADGFNPNGQPEGTTPPPGPVLWIRAGCQGSFFPAGPGLRGKVTGAPAGGIQAPIEGATVTAVGPITKTTNVDPTTAHYTMTLVAGDYQVTASAPGYESLTKPFTTGSDGLSCPLPLTFELHPPSYQLTLTVNPATLAPAGTADASTSGTAHLHAVVTKDGAPAAGIHVTMEAQVPTGGGHAHGGNRPTGTVAGGGCTTGPDGTCDALYTPSVCAGTERVKGYTTVSGASPISEQTVELQVRVPGLTALPGGADYQLTGQTLQHGANHYGTGNTVAAIFAIAGLYRLEFVGTPQEGRLGINDMSLVDGGLFDIDGTWSTPHAWHRKGTSVDVDTRYQLFTGEYVAADQLLLNDLADDFAAVRYETAVIHYEFPE